MGIYKQGNTFWVSKCINGIQYRKSAETSSKMEAKAFCESWVAELKEAVKEGKSLIKIKPVPDQSITFSELIKIYLEYTAGRLKSHSGQKVFTKKLLQTFGNVKLSSIDIPLIEKMQSGIIASGLSAAYANRLTATVKRMFTKASDWNLISEDDLRRIRKVKLLKGEIHRLKYLTEEESERLIGNCDDYLRPIVVTALNTGMRKGEILSLAWDRVDLKNRIILLDKTKNGERREIPVNNILYITLSGLTRRLDTKLVFVNPDTLKPYYDLKKPFGRALAKSHIADFRFHDLRHTFASRLVMKGVDLTTVRDLMGHKDIKMTLRYAHLAKSHIRDAVNMLDEKNYHNFIIAEENKSLSKS